MRRTALLLVLVAIYSACAGRLEPTEFTNPKFNFGFVEKVAVVPLENLSDDRQAGARATRLLITELLSSGAVDVVEPGEVQAALDQIGTGGRTLDTGDVIELGKMLNVQGVIQGAVTQSENLRSGTVVIPSVTLDVHMLETETGAAVWAATHTEKGGGLGAKLLGTSAEPISATTRRCVRIIVGTLVQ